MITIETHSINVKTQGNCEIIDLTPNVQEIIREKSFIEGNALIFASGSTAGITTIEYEPGLLKDYPKFFEKIIPSNISYHHDETWHDDNGHSHVRSALQGTSFVVPFKEGKLLLGTWQQIVLIDFDNRSRSRSIVVQLMGEKV